MKGKVTVIEKLNQLLSAELAAIDQYFIHSEMYKDWGLEGLYERIAHEVEDERDHAQALIRRILLLEGKPDVVTRPSINVGSDVKEMMESDLALELEVVSALKEVIAHCESEQDYQTREILEKLLEDTEEDHAYWIETQLGLIQRIGIENYQQSKM